MAGQQGRGRGEFPRSFTRIMRQSTSRPEGCSGSNSCASMTKATVMFRVGWVSNSLKGARRGTPPPFKHPWSILCRFDEKREQPRNGAVLTVSSRGQTAAGLPNMSRAHRALGPAILAAAWLAGILADLGACHDAAQALQPFSRRRTLARLLATATSRRPSAPTTCSPTSALMMLSI